MAKSSPPRANRPRRPVALQAEPTPIVIWAPPVGAPMASGLDADAVEVFERAMASLQRHDYRTALDRFEDLARQYPAEGALVDRSRIYAALCRRSLARAADDAPRTIGEQLTAATAALNDGDEARAERLVVQVLGAEPGHDLAHYLLAVAHARRGATAAALDALSRAVTANPEVRVQARYDDDFEPLRGSDAFELLLMDAPAQSGTGRN